MLVTPQEFGYTQYLVFYSQSKFKLVSSSSNNSNFSLYLYKHTTTCVFTFLIPWSKFESFEFPSQPPICFFHCAWSLMEITHCKQKQKQVLPLPPPPYRRRVTVFAGKSREEVKLAAIAISLNVRLRSAEMPFTMQERAVRHARSLLGSTTQRRPNPTPLALSLKKVLISPPSLFIHICICWFFYWSMMMGDWLGVWLGVWAGVALCGGEEFWIVRYIFAWWFRVFLHWWFSVISSFQNGGSFGQGTIIHLINSLLYFHFSPFSSFLASVVNFSLDCRRKKWTWNCMLSLGGWIFLCLDYIVNWAIISQSTQSPVCLAKLF